MQHQAGTHACCPAQLNITHAAMLQTSCPTLSPPPPLLLPLLLLPLQLLLAARAVQLFLGTERSCEHDTALGAHLAPRLASCARVCRTSAALLVWGWRVPPGAQPVVGRLSHDPSQLRPHGLTLSSGQWRYGWRTVTTNQYWWSGAVQSVADDTTGRVDLRLPSNCVLASPVVLLTRASIPAGQVQPGACSRHLLVDARRRQPVCDRKRQHPDHRLKHS